MALTEVAICNLAIGWLGGNLISSLDDDSEEARLCKANYEASRDSALEDRDWTFATSRKQLTQNPDYPGFGSYNSFHLPADHIRTIAVSASPDFDDNIDWFKEQNLILAITDVMYIRYIFRQKQVAYFSPNFQQAVAARLAHDICTPLTHNEKLKGMMWDEYLIRVEWTGALDGVQGVSQPLIKSSELINAR